MNQFIVVTQTVGGDVHINVDHVVTVEQDEACCMVCLTNGHIINVSDTIHSVVSMLNEANGVSA